MEWRLNHVGQMAQSVQDYSSCVLLILSANFDDTRLEKEVIYIAKIIEIIVIPSDAIIE